MRRMSCYLGAGLNTIYTEPRLSEEEGLRTVASLQRGKTSGARRLSAELQAVALAPGGGAVLTDLVNGVHDPSLTITSF